MNLTIHEAIDQAVAKMRPIRRAVMQRRLQNEDYRAQVADELLLRLWADKGCCTLVPELNLAKAQDAFTATSTFAIDPENLEKFLEIVLKYLPQILELLLKFLPLLMSLLLVACIAGQAEAQYVYPATVQAESGGCTGSFESESELRLHWFCCSGQRLRMHRLCSGSVLRMHWFCGEVLGLRLHWFCSCAGELWLERFISGEGQAADAIHPREQAFTLAGEGYSRRCAG